MGCSVLYLLLSIMSWLLMSRAKFTSAAFTEAYSERLYDYALEIERMKLVHANFLALIAGFIFVVVKKNKILTTR